MPGAEFLDTNILVYAYDISDPEKQRVAQELVSKAVAGELLTSPQVLTEFAATLLHKISPPVPAEDVMILLDALSPIRLIPANGGTVRRAVEVRARYHLDFHDSLIVAAAEQGSCRVIWSEDLNSGQEYFGVRVQNPFTSPQRP